MGGNRLLLSALRRKQCVLQPGRGTSGAWNRPSLSFCHPAKCSTQLDTSSYCGRSPRQSSGPNDTKTDINLQHARGGPRARPRPDVFVFRGDRWPSVVGPARPGPAGRLKDGCSAHTLERRADGARGAGPLRAPALPPAVAQGARRAGVPAGQRARHRYAPRRAPP